MFVWEEAGGDKMRSTNTTFSQQQAMHLVIALVATGCLSRYLR